MTTATTERLSGVDAVLAGDLPATHAQLVDVFGQVVDALGALLDGTTGRGLEIATLRGRLQALTERPTVNMAATVAVMLAEDAARQ